MSISSRLTNAIERKRWWAPSDWRFLMDCGAEEIIWLEKLVDIKVVYAKRLQHERDLLIEMFKDEWEAQRSGLPCPDPLMVARSRRAVKEGDFISTSDLIAKLQRLGVDKTS